MKRAVAISLFLACSGLLLADSPGSGGPARQEPPLLRDLVRMTGAGLSDATVLAYAKAHRLELPPELSADDLVWLRKSGVSETVVQYMAAIDVRAPDAAEGEDAADDSEETSGYPAAVRSDADGDYGSYSDGDYGSYSGSYPESDYGSYPESDYGDYAGSVYDGYPASYYCDYYPVYAAGYYPYPVSFFVSQSGFFGRFHGRGHGRRHGFSGRHGHSVGHGGFGHQRFPRGDFDRSLGRPRGSVVAARPGAGRAASPRGSVRQAFRVPRESVIRRGGPGRATFPRGGFGSGPGAPRGAVIRGGGAGRPAFAGGGRGPGFAGGGRAGGGGIGRAPIVRSGASRGAAARPTVGGRR